MRQGGIVDRRGIKAALALGAEGVQIETAFLACDDSSAPELHKQQLFSNAARRTALTRAFSGRLARGIENRFTQDFRNNQDSLLAYPAQSWLNSQLRSTALRQERSDLLAMWCSQAAPLLKQRHLDHLWQELIAGFGG